MKKAFLIGFLGCLLLLSACSKMTEPMPQFPSYDWDYDENKLLASVAANTPGTGVDKQKAIIEVLKEVWINKTSISNCIHIPLENEPTEYDYELVWDIVRGRWVNE